MAGTVSVDNCVAAAVATLVYDNNRLLLGRRVRQNQFQGWQCPGGYLLEGETVEQAASRVCLQDAGIAVKLTHAGPYTNNLFQHDQTPAHTVTLYQLAQVNRVVDAQLYSEWDWHPFDELPGALFLPLRLLLENYELQQLVTP